MKRIWYPTCNSLSWNCKRCHRKSGTKRCSPPHLQAPRRDRFWLCLWGLHHHFPAKSAKCWIKMGQSWPGAYTFHIFHDLPKCQQTAHFVQVIGKSDLLTTIFGHIFCQSDRCYTSWLCAHHNLFFETNETGWTRWTRESCEARDLNSCLVVWHQTLCVANLCRSLCGTNLWLKASKALTSCGMSVDLKSTPICHSAKVWPLKLNLWSF